jgi:hypothetical protein
MSKTIINLSIDSLTWEKFKQLTTKGQYSDLIEKFLISYLEANNAIKDEDEIKLRQEKEEISKQQSNLISKLSLINLKLDKIEQIKNDTAEMNMASLKAADILNQLED